MTEEENQTEPVVSPDVTPSADKRVKQYANLVLAIILTAIIASLAIAHKSPKAVSNTSKTTASSLNKPVVAPSPSGINGHNQAVGQGKATSAASSAPLASGEQLSKPSAQRPGQYTNICSDDTSTSTIYISQGDPECLANATFQANSDDENPEFPDSQFNFACQTTGGSTLRYVYITSGDECPTSTVAVN